MMLIAAVDFAITAMLWINADNIYELHRKMQKSQIPFVMFEQYLDEPGRWIMRFRISLIVFFLCILSLLLFQLYG
jgi:hypothetical protein